MIKKNIEEAINAQINFELFSSYLYLSMASWYSEKSLDGFANWMKVQAQEEVVHAMKFYNYIEERGGRVMLGQIDAPETEWKNALIPFEQAYEHEKIVTSRINDIMELASDEKDYATQSMLKWYIDEQVEEEKNTEDIAGQIKLVQDSNHGLLMLDRELAQRTFNMPANVNLGNFFGVVAGGA